jgi:nuclear receptor interaction protein
VGAAQGYVQRYRGHISRQTIKDVAFVGPDDCAVAAGSDDGRMFLWDRATGALAMHACTMLDNHQAPVHKGP